MMAEYLILQFAFVTQTFNLPPGLLEAIARVESNHDHLAYVHNDGGSPSVGLMQLKVPTAQLCGFKGSEADLRLVHNNVFYAGCYLRRKLDTYGGDVARAICAYNRGSCKPGQGKAYTDKVMKAWVGAKVATGTANQETTKALSLPTP